MEKHIEALNWIDHQIEVNEICIKNASEEDKAKFDWLYKERVEDIEKFQLIKGMVLHDMEFVAAREMLHKLLMEGEI